LNYYICHLLAFYLEIKFNENTGKKLYKINNKETTPTNAKKILRFSSKFEKKVIKKGIKKGKFYP